MSIASALSYLMGSRKPLALPALKASTHECLIYFNNEKVLKTISSFFYAL